MAREFHIYGYSRYAKDVYPYNKGDDFVIHLSDPVHLEGEWECGLVQFDYNTATDSPYFVCCDIVMESNVGEYKMPALRRVKTSGKKPATQFNHVIYVALKSHDFNSIRIYMKTWKNYPPTRIRAGTHCTLHFRRIA